MYIVMSISSIFIQVEQYSNLPDKAKVESKL